MKKLLVLVALPLLVSLANAQTVNFRLEKNFVFAGASVINPDGAALAIDASTTVLSAVMSSSVLNALTFDTAQADGPDTFISQVKALESAVTLNPWATVPIASTTLQNNFNAGWNLSRSGMSIGGTPVLLIATSPLASLAAGDYVGLIASTSVVPSLGTLTVSFSSTTPWNIYKIGSAGSLNLVQVVPEPSTYALIGGVLALGFVMWRRRR